jgi:DNA-binding transcriptional MocR family regulator
MMTNWMPSLSDGAGPIYVRLADRIEADIAAGALPAGVKLPPQRNLAFDLGVTIGTIGRAYALVRERGLVSGEVGRGTFVLGSGNEPARQAQPEVFGGTRFAPTPGKLRMDSTAAPDVGQARPIAELAARIARDHAAEMLDYVRQPLPSWLEAGRAWLSRPGWEPQTESIVPTAGAHAAIMAVIAAMTAPGDRIVFEALTYSSIARSAALIGRRPVLVEIDSDGMIPEDFEHVCAQQHPKLAFLMPSLHNPTLATLPADRLAEIVGIARRHNVWLIEDMVFGNLVEGAPATLVTLAPERTFHVGSLSKSVAAGLRAGWVACPPHTAQRVHTASRMVSGSLPTFLMTETAARLVLSGEAEAIRRTVRAETAAREAIAKDILTGSDFASRPDIPFLWMKLPEPWLSGLFRRAVSEEGVLVDEEDEYKPARTERTHHRVRVGFSSVATREDVARGFDTIRRVIEGGIAGHDSFG